MPVSARSIAAERVLLCLAASSLASVSTEVHLLHSRLRSALMGQHTTENSLLGLVKQRSKQDKRLQISIVSGLEPPVLLRV